MNRFLYRPKKSCRLLSTLNSQSNEESDQMIMKRNERVLQQYITTTATALGGAHTASTPRLYSTQCRYRVHFPRTAS